MKTFLCALICTVFLSAWLRPQVCDAETFAYVANGDGTVSVIDTENHTLVSDADGEILTIDGVGNGPHGVAVSPIGNYVFVSDPGTHSVSVIRTSDSSLYDQIIGGSDFNPQGVAVSANGKYLYLTASTAAPPGALYAINTKSGASIGSIAVGEQPFGLVAFTKDEKYYVCVANQEPERNEGSVSVIENSSQVASPWVGDSPKGVAVSPDLEYVYVTNSGKNTVSFIPVSGPDPSTLLADVEENPTGITTATDTDNRYDVYVANTGSDSVSVIHIQTDAQDRHADPAVTLVQVPNDPEIGQFDQPYGVSATPDGRNVYVTNKGNGTVSVIDTATYRIIKTIDVGREPTSLGNFIGMIPPDAPTDFKASESNGSIRLEWTDNSSDELGFEIDRKTDSDGEYSLLHTTSPNVDSYEDTTVGEMTTYLYRIRAVNAVGDSEYATNQASTPLNAPVKLSKADRSTDTITLIWKDRSGIETGFEIERRTVAEATSDSGNTDDDEETETDFGTLSTNTTTGDFAKIATVGADVTKYTDTGLKSNSSYAYRVRAYQSPEETASMAFSTQTSGQTEYSAYSNEIEADTSEDYLCFIGTIHGNFSSAPEVAPLGAFRHLYLSLLLVSSSAGIIVGSFWKKIKSPSQITCSSAL
jgi:YVTN family beta-propeller protein